MSSPAPPPSPSSPTPAPASPSPAPASPGAPQPHRPDHGGDHAGVKVRNRGFKRVLGQLDAIVLGFGAMIGFGWVILTGEWLRDAGTFGAALAFVIGGSIMAVVALVYGELVSAMPYAGGEHSYLLRAMGPRGGFIGSWAITSGYITVVMFEAVAVPRTLTYMVPQIQQIPLWEVAGSQVYLLWALIGTACAVVVTGINIRGVRGASSAQTFVVLFLVIVVILLAIGAFTGGQRGHMEPFFTPGTVGILSVIMTVPFLYVGFDVIPQVSEEMNLPHRTLGRTIVIAVALTTVWYIVMLIATSAAMPASELAETDIATADAMAALFGGPIWGNVLLAGGLAGILTSWNSLLMGSSRLLWALGESRMIPKWFAKMHPKYGTPVNALLFVGILSALAPFGGEVMLGWLVDAGSPNIVLAYALVSIGFVILRRREPGMPRPFTIGRKPRTGMVVGVISIILCVALTATYLPGLPSSLDLPPYLIFIAWWVMAIFFIVRLPRGIGPGPDAEERLHAAVDARDARRTGAGARRT